MVELRTYTIPGNPVPWARAGHAKTHMYDTQKKLKICYGLILKKQHKGAMYEGALLLEVTFYFPMPLCKQKQWPQLNNTPHYKKPDNSNCVKFLEDAICDILIADDAIIADIHSRKRYSYEPRTVFKLIKL